MGLDHFHVGIDQGMGCCLDAIKNKKGSLCERRDWGKDCKRERRSRSREEEACKHFFLAEFLGHDFFLLNGVFVY